MKPERGQVCENSAHSSIKERCDVLHDDVSRSKFANKTCVLGPQSRAWSFNPGTRSGKRYVLAGESSADDFDRPNIGTPESSNVWVDWHVGPVLAEDSLAEWFDLTEGDSSHPGSFESEGETADSAKEVEDIQ